MTGYRFHPLRDFPRAGVLVPPDGKPFPVAFLTPAQAKADAIKRLLIIPPPT